MDVIDPVETEGAPRGGRHLARNVALVAAIVLVAFVALLATRPTSDSDRPEAKIVGQAVPQVKGQTLDGTAYDIDAHRGSWVVVNFFASWCPPCRTEQPELVAFAKEHPDVQVVGVAFQDKEADVRNFFQQNGNGNWPVLIGDTGGTALSFGVTRVPESYLISPEGQVVAKFEGVTQGQLDQVIARYSATSQGTTP